MNINELLKRQKELNAIRAPQKEALGKNLIEGMRLEHELSKLITPKQRASLWEQKSKQKHERVMLEIELAKTSSEYREVRDKLHYAYKAERGDVQPEINAVATITPMMDTELERAVIRVRDDYAAFANDPMRVRSARKLAKEVVDRLNEILLPY
jgi:hypothetical protein